MTLIEYIKQVNKEAKEWMDAAPGRFSSMWSEDEAHWHEYGVYTVEDFKKYDLKSMIWDGFKSIHGVRPRHLDLDNMSLEELENELKSLQNEE